jgi:hypothetical protein
MTLPHDARRTPRAELTWSPVTHPGPSGGGAGMGQSLAPE